MKKIKMTITIIFSLILITGCYNSDQVAVKTKNINSDNIPHSSAFIACKILDIVVEDDIFNTLVMIDTVYGYGSAAPPISEKSELKINITKNQYKSFKEYLDVNDRDFEFEIYKPKQGFGMKSENIWKLNKIIKR